MTTAIGGLERSLGFIIDGFICISLEECKERRKEVEKEFTKMGIKVQFQLEKRAKDPVDGCKISHKKAIEYAKAQGWRKVAVFEDDVYFDPTTIARMKVPEFDILYLGCNPCIGTRFNANLLHLTWVYTTHAYIMDCDVYDYVISGLSKDFTQEPEIKAQPSIEVPHAVDVFYSFMVAKKRNKCYTLYPMIAHQRATVSTITGQSVDYTPELKRRADAIANYRPRKLNV